MPRELLFLLVLLAGGCAGAPRPEERPRRDLAGRQRPLHAKDLGASSSGETEGPPTTWVHYHLTEASFQDARLAGEPMAPDGTRRLMLVAVAGCRCGEEALSAFGGADSPGEGEAHPVPALDAPQVDSQWSGETLWVWVRNARPGVAYTLQVGSDPPERLLADPIATVSAGEFARYPIAGPVREIKARLIRIQDLRYPEVK